MKTLGSKYLLGNEIYILAQVDRSVVGLINLNGGRLSDPVKVENLDKISDEEWSRLAGIDKDSLEQVYPIQTFNVLFPNGNMMKPFPAGFYWARRDGSNLFIQRFDQVLYLKDGDYREVSIAQLVELTVRR